MHPPNTPSNPMLPIPARGARDGVSKIGRSGITIKNSLTEGVLSAHLLVYDREIRPRVGKPLKGRRKISQRRAWTKPKSALVKENSEAQQFPVRKILLHHVLVQRLVLHTRLTVADHRPIRQQLPGWKIRKGRFLRNHSKQPLVGAS